MTTKTLQFEVPEFLTVEQYDKISAVETDDKLDKIVRTISGLTDYSEEEIRTWSMNSLKEVYKQYSSLSDFQEEFHSLLEWNGKLYGYAHIKNSTLGEYVDLEYLCKNITGNLHKIAAILYRPVTNHRFDSLSFTVKQKLKMVNNKVENVFDWYEVEQYDSKKRKQVEESFKKFPVHILLGALTFFLTTGSLYLSNTASSEDLMSKNSKIMMEQMTLRNLSQNIMAGSGLFTSYLKPIYLKLQETEQSQILTL